MNWKPGDLAIVMCDSAAEDKANLTGRVVKLERRTTGPGGGPWWRVDGIYKVAESVLRPLYDGNDPATWDDCVWQPKELCHE